MLKIDDSRFSLKVEQSNILIREVKNVPPSFKHIAC